MMSLVLAQMLNPAGPDDSPADQVLLASEHAGSWLAMSILYFTGAAALGLALAGWDHFRGRDVIATTRLPFGALLAGVALILLWLGPDWLEMVR
jgi:hypothetical protein